jgi:iron-sulfur cluster repair protein YtfE (RIC family)
MTLFTLLKQDHDKVKREFKALMQQDEIDVDVLESICNELTIHMQMEEKYLYPVMQKEESAKEITEEAILEHQEAKKLVDEILDGDLDTTELKVKAEMLQLAIEHHVKEEEDELFAEIKDSLSEDRIDEIAQQMITFKEKAQKTSVRK